MSQAAVALLGAAIGAFASVGGAVMQALLSNRAEARKRREQRSSQEEERRHALVQAYLFQLQDAAESLRQRLDNWADREGERWSESVHPGYWRVTTLYAVARALAAERIPLLEGLHAELDRLFGDLGTFLKTSPVDPTVSALMSTLFYYDRMALAESVLQRESGTYRLRTYTEWRTLYEHDSSGLSSLVKPAAEALERLDAHDPRLGAASARLGASLERLGAATGVPGLPSTIGRPRPGGAIG